MLPEKYFLKAFLSPKPLAGHNYKTQANKKDLRLTMLNDNIPADKYLLILPINQNEKKGDEVYILAYGFHIR